jgi:hypothetical protein
MLSYSDLTQSQRKWVDLVELTFPNTGEYLNYDDIKNIHAKFTELRVTNKNYKCSKALWLITHNSVSRGKYKFPSSLVYDLQEGVEIIDTELEALYKQELMKFGISIKK